MRLFAIIFLVTLNSLLAKSQDSFESRALLVRLLNSDPIRSVDLNGNLDVDLTFKLISSHYQLYKCTWTSGQSEKEMKQVLDSILGNKAEISLNYQVTFRNRITPNDPEFGQQWYLDKIKAPEVWAQTTGGLTALGDTVVIAVLEETGPELLHEDLLESYWFNHGEIPGDGIDNDNNGYTDDYWGINLATKNDQHQPDNRNSRHATPVCGLLGAQGNNGKQVAGVNWSSKIMVISGLKFVDQTIEAYEYVIDMRTRYNQSGGTEGAFIVVTNASFGLDGYKPDDAPILQTWCDMFDRLGALGILTAAAAPNQDYDVDVIGDMPTNCPSQYLIGVTSTDQDDKQARFTGYGTGSIDITAPGTNLWTTAPSGGPATFDGTSAATPLVCGAIALLHTIPSEDFAAAYKEKPAEIALLMKSAILNRADKFSSLNNRVSSSGRLNIFNSMIFLADMGFGKLAPVFGINNLYPNPSRNLINLLIDFRSAAISEVCIYNVHGQLVYCKDVIPEIFNENILDLDISHLIPGLYVLSVRQGSNITSKIFAKM